jgi:hypothetical protein
MSTRKIAKGRGKKRERVESIYTAIVSPTALKWQWPNPSHRFSASRSKFKHCKIFVSFFCKLM